MGRFLSIYLGRTDVVKSCPFDCRLIAVPTHFFKVFMGRRFIKVDSGSVEMELVVFAAFLVPNEPVPIDVSLLIC